MVDVWMNFLRNTLWACFHVLMIHGWHVRWHKGQTHQWFQYLTIFIDTVSIEICLVKFDSISDYLVLKRLQTSMPFWHILPNTGICCLFVCFLYAINVSVEQVLLSLKTLEISCATRYKLIIYPIIWAI